MDVARNIEGQHIRVPMDTFKWLSYRIFNRGFPRWFQTAPNATKPHQLDLYRLGLRLFFIEDTYSYIDHVGTFVTIKRLETFLGFAGRYLRSNRVESFDYAEARWRMKK